MNTMYKQLLESTEDLLYRVRIYDRNLEKSDEILQMDEAYKHMRLAFDVIEARQDNGMMERFAGRLQQMRTRLITMMEDLLHTA